MKAGAEQLVGRAISVASPFNDSRTSLSLITATEIEITHFATST